METAIIIAAAFAFGGILKGATGFGAPVLAIPLLALFFDVPFAVTIFAVPNLVPNLWQSWAFRAQRLPLGFILRFTLSGALGAGIGTFMLAKLPENVLSLVLAAIIFAYVTFRLLRPSWKLAYPLALKLTPPVGIIAGILQGGAGLSAPASLTFLNAMQLEREQFIATISMFFVSLSLVQIPLLASYGYMTATNFALSSAALIPLVAFMPVGARLARHISPKMFDRIILTILSLLGIKLFLSALG
jgi:uncharacterized protein